MPAMKRDDNKIVAFIRERDTKGLDTTPRELINYIKDTFNIAHQPNCSLIITNLIKRGRLKRASPRGLIYVIEKK